MTEEADFKDRDAFDEGERELCPDGNCTGLIGADGRCKVCGLSRSGERADAVEPRQATAGDEASAGPLAEAEPDDDRELCPDGNCLGLIGSDGKCKVCGHPAAS